MPHSGYERPDDIRDTEALQGRVSRMILVAKQAGATQEIIATGVGTNQGNVSAWELRKTVPSVLFLTRLTRFCSRPGATYDFNWVMTGKGEEYVRPTRETPDEAYVRAGLTVLARFEEATGDIRRELLKAGQRLTAGVATSARHVHEEVTTALRSKRPVKGRRRTG